MNENLRELLNFIEGKVFPYTTGITTHICQDENQTKLHNALLDLEKLGKVERHREENNSVVWKPMNTEREFTGLTCQECFKHEATMQDDDGEYLCSECYNN